LYAPVLDATFPNTLEEFQSCGVVRFVRNLLQNPESSRYIKQMRICWSQRIGDEPQGSDFDTPTLESPTIPADIEAQMSRLTTTLRIPRVPKGSGSENSFCNLVKESVAILLAMMPPLETLCIS